MSLQQHYGLKFGGQEVTICNFTTNNLLNSAADFHFRLAFSVAGPVCWSSLPDYLKSSDLSFNCFRQQLKHFYFVNIDTSPSTTLTH